MGDLFLVLAQAPGGLTCFALPRWTPDGLQPGVRPAPQGQVGQPANASAEIELDGAWAERVGDVGRGVATIIEMVNHTRLDWVVGAAAGMRQALSQATHHCAYRYAFGRRLADHPLMTAVLADLAVESEAATVTMLRLAGAYDRAGGDEHGARFPAWRPPSPSIGSASARPPWRPRPSSAWAATAMSRSRSCPGCSGKARSTASGKGRATSSASTCGAPWPANRSRSRRSSTRSARPAVATTASMPPPAPSPPRSTRDLRGRGAPSGGEMALVLQGALLVRHGHPAVADAFVASWLEGDWGRAFGTLPTGLDVAAIMTQARVLRFHRRATPSLTTAPRRQFGTGWRPGRPPRARRARSTRRHRPPGRRPRS